MARPESMDAKFPMAQKYDAGLVALLWGPSGLPRDADERGVLAAELMQKAIEFGIPGKISGWIRSSPLSPVPRARFRSRAVSNS